MAAMNRTPTLAMAIAGIALLSLLPANAESSATPLVGDNIQADEDWQQDWTIVTMARDGSWGAASHQLMGRAIAAAIDNCKAMTASKTDCGAEFRAVRGGWVLGLLCGDHKVLASGKRREDAEGDARIRIDIKRAYIPDLPPCRTVLIVDSRRPETVIKHARTKSQ